MAKALRPSARDLIRFVILRANERRQARHKELADAAELANREVQGPLREAAQLALDRLPVPADHRAFVQQAGLMGLKVTERREWSWDEDKPPRLITAVSGSRAAELQTGPEFDRAIAEMRAGQERYRALLAAKAEERPDIRSVFDLALRQLPEAATPHMDALLDLVEELLEREAPAAG